MATIFLDMDGVCSSFTDHALFTHNRPEVKIIHWDIESQLGLTKKQFQKPINDSGAAWWSSMPETPWFKKIVNFANRFFDEVYFLSSPADYCGASEGKRVWLQRRLGKEFNNFIFTQHKHVCAKPNSVLVDDSDMNCDAFIKAGGHAVRFPQPWSSTKEFTHDPMSYLERQLEDAIKKIRAYEDYMQALVENTSEEEEDFDPTEDI